MGRPEHPSSENAGDGVGGGSSAVNLQIAMPSLGFGTYGRRDVAGVRAIRQALEVGFRHLDTAQDYQTEVEVGQAIRESAIARDSVYVTTKVATANLGAGLVIPSLQASLRQLQVDQVDLALIHWPAPNGAIEPAVYLEQLKQAQDAGLCRDIGVSNFTVALLERAKVVLGPQALTCNQVELNPLFKNRTLADYCDGEGIRVTCYLPIARGRLSGNPVLAQIAKAHGKTGEQIGIAWELARGYAAIPTSSQHDRIILAHGAGEINLTPADIAAIDAIPDEPRVIAPAWGPQWD